MNEEKEREKREFKRREGNERKAEEGKREKEGGKVKVDTYKLVFINVA